MNGDASLSMDDPGRWYALYASSRFERKVHDGLDGKSFTVFLPQIQVMSRRKDRHKKILIPMIPGYVFVRSCMEPEQYHRIIRTPGVVRMVGFEGKPIPVNEGEIKSLMILDGTDRTVQNRAFLKRGERVMIMEGPLAGLVGIFLRRKGMKDKVVVSVELLKRSLAVELDDWALEKVV